MNNKKPETILHRIATDFTNNNLYSFAFIDEENGLPTGDVMELFYSMGLQEEYINEYMNYTDAPTFMLLDIREIYYLNKVFKDWKENHNNIPLGLWMNLQLDIVEENLNKILDDQLKTPIEP